MEQIAYRRVITKGANFIRYDNKKALHIHRVSIFYQVFINGVYIGDVVPIREYFYAAKDFLIISNSCQTRRIAAQNLPLIIS